MVLMQSMTDIDVDVEVEAHVTEMLNGTGAADGGCEWAGAAGGITVAMAIMRGLMVMITV